MYCIGIQARTPPLIVASKDNCRKIVEYLLKYGVDINRRDKVSEFTHMLWYMYMYMYVVCRIEIDSQAVVFYSIV